MENTITNFKSLEEFTDFVMNAEVDKSYDLPEFRYGKLEIQEEIVGFTWAIEHNHSLTGRVGYIFPESSGRTTNFKTEKGAKRNLIKRCAFIFE